VSAGGDKEAVRKRAEAYWALMRTNDKVAAWAYEAQSKDPNGSLEGYMKRGGITYDVVEVRDVRSIEGDKAVVDVFMRYSAPLLRIKGQEAVAQDEWQRIDGQCDVSVVMYFTLRCCDVATIGAVACFWRK
jgi:hypothetical protein